MTRRARALAGERGSGSVLVVAVAAVVVVVLAAVVVATGVVLARHRAESAADLGALAAAEALQTGAAPGAACGRALALARTQGAHATCTVTGQDVLVDATTPLPALAGLGGRRATARARAGPER